MRKKMDTLKLFHPEFAKAYQQHQQNPYLCFKRCCYHIVAMHYAKNENNLHRKGVVAPQYAKFRTKYVTVLFIYDTRTKKLVSKCFHKSYNDTIYKVNEVTFADKWDPQNTDEICTHGIHFYLNLWAAVCHDPWYNRCRNWLDCGTQIKPISHFQISNLHW